MNRAQFIEELPRWLERNFPDATPSQQFLGVMEEIGELAENVLVLEPMSQHEHYLMRVMAILGELTHCRLKRIQNIREEEGRVRREYLLVSDLIKAVVLYRDEIVKEEKITQAVPLTERSLRGIITKRNDAIGDLDIFLQSFCYKSHLDRERILEETWDMVRERDWKQFPKDGTTT